MGRQSLRVTERAHGFLAPHSAVPKSFVEGATSLRDDRPMLLTELLLSDRVAPKGASINQRNADFFDPSQCLGLRTG